ncbi:serine protease [Paenibacillus swuensis]|uniref:Serine protease n=1 Tax=Paenibacillus swuensis TaxID=1178515 RepID=A0A172TJT7_9BACL|nr:nodulation protein NfeD [Paenibacillus swuensis]ANE47315.1 serine protease [Paenibacillus swuensis]
MDGKPGLSRFIVWVFLLQWIAALGAGTAGAEGNHGKGTTEIWVIPVQQGIESGLSQFVNRGLEKAEADGASHVILEMDTLGGRVDAAEFMGKSIRDSNVPVTVFVKGKAASAGSYLALNADRIVMAPGSTIGAAALVDGSGERVKDSKTISFWSGMMRSAAELNGRNGDIAAGMVDESAEVAMPEIKRTKKAGQIISLSAEEARKVGYSDHTAVDLKAVVSWLTPEGAAVKHVAPTWAEKVASWVTHPVVMTLLLILGLAGIAIELLVPGFGAPGIIGILSFGLYFFGHYIAGFAGVEEVLLFIVGIVLLASELFVPSFGILGILGIVSLISGVIMAAYDSDNALLSLGVATIVAAVIVTVFVRYFKHRGIWHKFILRDELTTDQGYVPADAKEDLLYHSGESITPLRPAGMVDIGGRRVDVVTEGEFIGSGKNVKVIRIEGTRVIVRETKE